MIFGALPPCIDSKADAAAPAGSDEVDASPCEAVDEAAAAGASEEAEIWEDEDGAGWRLKKAKASWSAAT